MTNSLESVIAYSERFRGQCLALSGEMTGAVSTGLDSLGTKRAVEERVRVELNEAKARLEAQRAKRAKQNNELLKHTAMVTPKIAAQEAELVELEAEAEAQNKVHALSADHLSALRKELGLNETGVSNQATLDANGERAKETAEQVRMHSPHLPRQLSDVDPPFLLSPCLPHPPHTLTSMSLSPCAFPSSPPPQVDALKARIVLDEGEIERHRDSEAALLERAKLTAIADGATGRVIAQEIDAVRS